LLQAVATNHCIPWPWKCGFWCHICHTFDIWITSLCVIVLMSAILENGALCESHTLPAMSSRSFVTSTPQWLVLDMQTNVGIRLSPTQKLDPFYGLHCSTIRVFHHWETNFVKVLRSMKLGTYVHWCTVVWPLTQIEGQCNGGLKVAKMANFQVSPLHVIITLMVNYGTAMQYLNFNLTDFWYIRPRSASRDLQT